MTGSLGCDFFKLHLNKNDRNDRYDRNDENDSRRKVCSMSHSLSVNDRNDKNDSRQKVLSIYNNWSVLPDEVSAGLQETSTRIF